MHRSEGEPTAILRELRDGDHAAAAERLLPLVYDELRALAGYIFQQQPAHHTLQPTALVHEAYLRLIGGAADWKDRAHFIAVAAMAMRQILSNYARDKRAAKRGGGDWDRITLEQADLGTPSAGLDLLVLDDALGKLAELSPRQARIVELRVLGGLTVEEVAEVLSLGMTTVKSEWLIARAWLKRQFSDVCP